MNSEMPILFPVEPDKFWQQMKKLIEEVLLEMLSQQRVSHPKQSLPDKPLLKIKDLCQIFGVSKPTLYEWINDNRIRSFKIRNRRYFTREDVEALMHGKPFPDSPFFSSVTVRV